ncbi:PRC-barrel domain-containing protein [Saccharopolyspora taberi]|uniref:PRC-barrel domain-containing protein n=1 Tax=Saccharopolyspora taberi TaxID=60895 RepID=A0ABN3VC09_9PSEU
MDVERAQDLIGSAVFDRSGSRIGRVGNVYVHDTTHQPEWVTVRSGFLGMRETFVPLTGASNRDDGINVDVTKDLVRGAPRVEAEHGHLSDEEGRDLFAHYGIEATTDSYDIEAGAESPVEELPESDVTERTTGRHRKAD